MGLVKCPDCEKVISERVEICPFCGCPKDFFLKNKSDIDGKCKDESNRTKTERVDNIKQEIENCRKFAEQGDAAAQNTLGCAYLDGTSGLAKDYGQAVKWFQKAINQGNLAAKNNLAICHRNGWGIEQDIEEAIKCHKELAEQGLAEAQRSLGYCYYTGIGLEKDLKQAFKWYEKAAEQRDAFAQYLLGACYAKGKGVEENKEEAAKWYQKAAEQGNANAQCSLGECYYYGEGVKENKEEAVKWYRQAAEQGHANAQRFLGACYHDGKGVEKNKKEARKWIEKAAEQGNADAQYLLGTCYDFGEGVKENKEEAVKWYRKAAEQGNVNAQCFLGRCYYGGEGVKEDKEEAVKWMKRAAEQGNADAQYLLGGSYFYGEGIEEDKEEAVKWMKKAAGQGQMDAKYFLAECCYNGDDGGRENKKNTEKMIELPLAGRVLRIDGSLKEYIEMRREYENIACRFVNNARKFYQETSSLASVIEEFSEEMKEKMNLIIDENMRMLYKCGIPMTPEAFMNKYYYNRKYKMDYNAIISQVVEKYAEIMDEKSSLQKYRDMQEASRSRWEGGGFGIKGAVKGAIMAGVLNAGTDFANSFGDSARRKSDNAYIQSRLKELKDSSFVQTRLINGGYTVIMEAFRAFYDELISHGLVSSATYRNERYEEAKNLCEAAEKYAEEKEAQLDEYFNAILKYPYYTKPYRLIYKMIHDKDERSQVFYILDYFGIEISIDGISTTVYMNIERYLDSCEALKNFDYEKIEPEQFYTAIEIADELKDKYDESILRKNSRYGKIHWYIRRVKDNAPKEMLDYESQSEKVLPMEEYIPRLIKKCMDTGEIGEKTFDGFLWVDGVEVGCEFENDIELFNYNKYIGKTKQYILIYENTASHMGRRGFGIFDEGIVFFEKRIVMYFKDIIEFEFVPSNIAIIVKTPQMSYEFEYRFYGTKIFGLFGKGEYIAMGEFLSINIILKILKHYQDLNRISSKSNREDMFCKYCGKQISRTVKFCNFCGAKVN